VIDADHRSRVVARQGVRDRRTDLVDEEVRADDSTEMKIASQRRGLESLS